MMVVQNEHHLCFPQRQQQQQQQQLADRLQDVGLGQNNILQSVLS